MTTPFNGGIKFFNKSQCLLVDGATCEASSGDVVQDFCIDSNPITFWNSVDSDDTISETLEIVFEEADITRLFLLDHNFKEYTIQWWNGSSYQNFTNVVGLDGALVGNISETTYSQDTSYYEFTEVTTRKILITVVKTQTVNDEKYLNQVIVTSELGTLTGYPDISKLKHSRSTVTMPMLSGKDIVIKGYASVSFSLVFKNYPASYTTDLDLIFTLFDKADPFLIWLCGGRYGTTYFKYTIRGFRLKDVYQCQVEGDLPVDYYKNAYVLPIDSEIKFTEHV